MNPLRSGITAAEEFLTRAQVAELFNVAPSTVTRWADEGKLVCVRTLGGHRRYQKDGIIKLLRTLTKEERMESTTVEIPRMYGDHHVNAVHKALATLPGIQDVWTSAAVRRLEVTYDPETVDEATILARLVEAGYPTKNGLPGAPAGVTPKDPAWAKQELRMTQTYAIGR